VCVLQLQRELIGLKAEVRLFLAELAREELERERIEARVREQIADRPLRLAERAADELEDELMRLSHEVRALLRKRKAAAGM
jgi:archaellum component FlaC